MTREKQPLNVTLRKRLILLGLGVVLALLISLPLIAIATGSLNDAPQYVMMNDVPERGDGAYVRVDDGTRRGVIKLYPWNFPLHEFPADAPRFNPQHIMAFIISQRGIDDPKRYHLYNLGDNSAVPLDAETRSTKIIYTLRAPLGDGRYMVDMPKSGLSSDRQYLYFVVDSAAVAPVPALDKPSE